LTPGLMGIRSVTTAGTGVTAASASMRSLGSSTERLHLPPAKRTGHRLHRNDMRHNPWAPAVDSYIATTSNRAGSGAGGGGGKGGGRGGMSGHGHGRGNASRPGTSGGISRDGGGGGGGGGGRGDARPPRQRSQREREMSGPRSRPGTAAAEFPRATTTGRLDKRLTSGEREPPTLATTAPPRVPEIVKHLLNVRRPGSAARRLTDASLALTAAAAADRLNYAEGAMVGLYKSNPVSRIQLTHSLKGARFQPLNQSEKLVSKFAFKFNLYRYSMEMNERPAGAAVEAPSGIASVGGCTS
jgi:hypothetical protein